MDCYSLFKQGCTTCCKQNCTCCYIKDEGGRNVYCCSLLKQCCTTCCKKNCTCCYNKVEEERLIFSEGHLQALEDVLFIDPVPSNTSKRLFLELNNQMQSKHQVHLRDGQVNDLKGGYAIVISDNQSRTLADVNNAMTYFDTRQYKQLILVVTYMDYDKNLAYNKYDLETQYPGLEFVIMNYRQVSCSEIRVSLDEDAVKATAEAVRKKKRQRNAILTKPDSDE